MSKVFFFEKHKSQVSVPPLGQFNPECGLREKSWWELSRPHPPFSCCCFSYRKTERAFMRNVGDCRCFCCRCWGHFPSNSAWRRLFCQLSANTKVLRRCQVFSSLFIFIFLSFLLWGQKVWRMSWENNFLSTSEIISGCFYFETLVIANFHVRLCLGRLLHVLRTSFLRFLDAEIIV